MHSKIARKPVDMLSGPILKNMLKFYFPLMLTSILQLLFNAADLAVVGSFCGSLYVAAVGSTGSLVNLLVNFFIGLSTGASVCVAQANGAKNYKAVSQTVHTAILLSFICGLSVSIIGFVFSRNFLVLMGTPDDIIAYSTIYLKIYFCGAIFNMIYNFGASILRAVGDTVKPLIFLFSAGLLNVILNIFFVVVFDMNVDGVALATAISQAVSAVLITVSLLKRTDSCKLVFKQIKIHKKYLSKILILGIPSGLQSTLFSFSNVTIQSSVNSFGSTVISGAAAAANIESFVYVFMNSFYHTALSFVGQNIGAKNIKRTREVVRCALICCIIIGAVTGVFARVFGKTLLGIFITDSKEAISYGIMRMNFVALTYFLCGIMEVLVAALRGMGSSVTPMLISIAGACGLRILWVYTLFQIPVLHTLSGLYVIYPISWIITDIAQFIAYRIVLKKKEAQIMASLQKE